MHDPSPRVADHSVSVVRLVCGYRRRIVLRNITIHFGSGEVTLILGANGSGKSTLLRAMYGLVPIKGGSVAYCGRKSRRISPGALLRDGVTFLPQGHNVFGSFTSEENFRLRLVALRRGELPQILMRGLERDLPSLPRVKSKQGQLLSGGERQQVALAGAVLTEPYVLLLDEPFSGLDSAAKIGARRALVELAANQGTTIIVADQKADDLLEEARRVVVLQPLQEPREFVRIRSAWRAEDQELIRRASGY